MNYTVSPAIEKRPPEVVRFHFTALSNFAFGYERYSRTYNKQHISKSTYPSKFYLLSRDNFEPGIEKARKLVSKLGISGDCVIALETKTRPSRLQNNSTTGIGEFIESSSIGLEAIYKVEPDNRLVPFVFEDAYSEAMRLIRPHLPGWNEVAPRSVSILPIARGCQAACPFCFSEASISREIRSKVLDFDRIDKVLCAAKQNGAERAVISGGGEPGLLKFSELKELIKLASRYFPKVVLITNGYFLAQREPAERDQALVELNESGLNVLAISRHHFDPKRNAKLMGLDTLSERIPESWRRVNDRLTKFHLRWICVLQRNGIETKEDVCQYVENALEAGVNDICFKELYISSQVESFYYSEISNKYSAENQIPLKVVLDAALERSWKSESALPWGAPIFTCGEPGKQLSIAAYTEPNTTWELSNRVCRSWNLMANGTCYASLEDRNSIVGDI